MELYLLFDSSCLKCTNLAHSIKQEFGEKLEIRSLHDTEIQKLLNNAKPEWQWEPTLLKIRDNHVQVYTKIEMGLQLVRALGIKNAIKVVKLVHQHEILALSNVPYSPSRRELLHQSTWATLALLLGIVPPSLSSKRPAPSSFQIDDSLVPLPKVQDVFEGEIWEGFILLPRIDTPWPDFVTCAPTPVLCAMDDQVDLAFRGEVISFDTTSDLVNNLPFRMYTFNNPDFTVSNSLLRFIGNQEVFVASIIYSTPTLRIRIRGRAIFPRPYPVLPVHSPTGGDALVVAPTKVKFLPTLGISRPSIDGYVFDWIKRDVLYTLDVEGVSEPITFEAATKIVQSMFYPT